MMQNSSGNSVPHCVDCFTQFEYSQYSPVYDSKQSHLHVVMLLKYYLNFYFNKYSTGHSKINFWTVFGGGGFWAIFWPKFSKFITREGEGGVKM